MEEKRHTNKVRSEQLHNVILENRRKLSVSGIEEVESFNEEEIILRTSHSGMLVIKGTGLHINKLNVDSGDVNISGDISNMDYIDESAKTKGPGLLSRLLR